MKKDLVGRQEQMRLRNLAIAKIKQQVNNVPIQVNAEQRPLCSNCKRRVARRGSLLCSRCTFKGVEGQLRDTLPGMPTEEKRERREQPKRMSDIFRAVDKTDKTKLEEVERKGFNELTLEQNHTEKTLLEEIQKPSPFLQENANYYTRKQVSRMIGVSPTTLVRWVRKGKISPPIKMAHSGQVLYSPELVEEARQFAIQMVPITPGIPRSPQQQAAKNVQKKTFKINKRLERAVSININKTGFRGLGKLM